MTALPLAAADVGTSKVAALEMVFTRVLFFECCFSSLTSARVQSRRTIRFVLTIVLAITFSLFYSRDSHSTTFWPERRVKQQAHKKDPRLTTDLFAQLKLQ